MYSFIFVFKTEISNKTTLPSILPYQIMSFFWAINPNNIVIDSLCILRTHTLFVVSFDCPSGALKDALYRS